VSVSPASSFFDYRREWSHWKHEILRRYLPKFAGILGSRYPTISYVDCFAGAGIYKGDPPVPGSPLIAAELAQTIGQSEKWPYALNCINVEPSLAHFDELCAATSAYPPSVVRNFRGTFNECLSDILAMIEKSPSLFFWIPLVTRGWSGPP
jgi:three-Cys-motif partner protein